MDSQRLFKSVICVPAHDPAGAAGVARRPAREASAAPPPDVRGATYAVRRPARAKASARRRGLLFTLVRGALYAYTFYLQSFKPASRERHVGLLYEKMAVDFHVDARRGVTCHT